MRKTGKAILFFIIDAIVTSFATVWIWNNTVSQLFGITTINVAQGWALSIVITYFFKDYKNEKIDDYGSWLFDDILYTLIIWLCAFVLALFAF